MNRSTVKIGAAVAGAAAGWAVERWLVRRIDAAASEAIPMVLPDDATDRWMDTPDGGVVHWIEAGTGRPLVLLHGITLEAEAWARQFVLAESCRVMALDLRGHGRSTAGSDGATIATNAADLSYMLETEDLRNVVLAGHSMGGMVVAHFLATASPETLARVDAVAFVDSALRAPVKVMPGAKRLDRFLQRPVFASILGTVPDTDAGRLAVMATFGRRPSTLDLQTVAQSFDRLDPATYWQSMPSILEHDLRRPLAARTDLDRLDVVVIVGQRDRLTPVRCARELVAAFPGSELVILTDVGHQSMMEAPAAVNELLLSLVAPSPRPSLP